MNLTSKFDKLQPDKWRQFNESELRTIAQRLTGLDLTDAPRKTCLAWIERVEEKRKVEGTQ